MNTVAMIKHKQAQYEAADYARQRGLELELEILHEALAAQDAEHDFNEAMSARHAVWAGFASLINMED